jgi:protein O-GlcNAc transferase
MTCGRLETARTTLESAVVMDSGCAEAFHLLGLLYRRMGRVQLAIESLAKAIAIDGRRPEFHKDLGNAHKDAGDLDQALECFNRALAQSPAYAAAWYDMGCALQTGGSLRAAAVCYRKTLSIEPRHTDALSNLGLVMEAGGRIQPDHAVALNNLGNIFKQKGDLQRALSCYQRAIGARPTMADAHNNKGFALWDLDRLAEASESFAVAHRLAPASDAILVNYANALLAAGRRRRALSAYQKVLQRNSQNKQALLNMGICYEGLGDLVQAEACYRNALVADKGYAKAQQQLVSLLMRTCQFDALHSASQALDRFTREALSRGEAPAETPFLNICRQDDAELNFKVARVWSHQIEKRYGGAIVMKRARIQVSSAPRLTIGYLSCNFRNHPTAQLLAGLFGCHDRRRFKILCYSYGIDDASPPREAIKQHCELFIDLRGVGDVEAAEKIGSDGVNILVDLGGFTRDSRLGIAAQRPAALQMRYLGMAGTTGASFFDYLLTDKIVTPPEQAPFYSERFLYMPGCYQVNHYQDGSEDVGLQRSQFGLPLKGHVYCAFHASYKIDDTVFDTWMRILRRVQNSVLWLCRADEITQANLVRCAQVSGIKAQRLIFAERLPKKEHLQRLQLADTALDSIRVTGAATTSDALWAQVPVVTLMGRHFASRMSASILKAAGLPQLVTSSLKAYEELAVRLACEPEMLNDIREQLRAGRERMSLFDTRRFVGSLEKGYDMIWKHHLTGRRPVMMDIGETASCWKDQGNLSIP